MILRPMASRKRISFRQAALVSGLVTQEQLTETVNALIRTLRAGGVNVKVTDKQIAEALIESELITTYQGEQLLLGQTRFNLGPYVVIDWIGQGGMGNVYKGVVHKVEASFQAAFVDFVIAVVV